MLLSFHKSANSLETVWVDPVQVYLVTENGDEATITFYTGPAKSDTVMVYDPKHNAGQRIHEAQEELRQGY